MFRLSLCRMVFICRAHTTWELPQVSFSCYLILGLHNSPFLLSLLFLFLFRVFIVTDCAARANDAILCVLFSSLLPLFFDILLHFVLFSIRLRSMFGTVGIFFILFCFYFFLFNILSLYFSQSSRSSRHTPRFNYVIVFALHYNIIMCSIVLRFSLIYTVSLCVFGLAKKDAMDGMLT